MKQLLLETSQQGTALLDCERASSDESHVIS